MGNHYDVALSASWQQSGFIFKQAKKNVLIKNNKQFGDNKVNLMFHCLQDTNWELNNFN